MPVPSPKFTSRKLGEAAGVLLACTVVGAAAATVAAIRLARKTVIPVPHTDDLVHVESIAQIGPRLVARLSGPDVSLPGKYSFLFDERRGHAKLGAVIEDSGDSVTREIVSVDRGVLHSGATGYVNSWWYSGPEDLGLRVEHITIPMEFGETTAWILHPRRARKRHWAVHVHGRGGLPEETLRGVAPLAQLGVTSIVISYRNDPDAPAGRQGRYGLGISEARDVDAAVGEAVRRGAGRVTLFGWSMGGTASLTAAIEGEHRNVIDGLVLDSPAVDWDGVLRYHAGIVRVPAPVTRLGISLLRTGTIAGGEPEGIDFDRLTPNYFARTLRVPVLIHASRNDTFVPSAGSELLARVRPDLVQLRLTEQGAHVRLWNVDSDGWETATKRFMRQLPRPAWRG